MNHDTDYLQDRFERDSIAFEADLVKRLREAMADGELAKEPLTCEWTICNYCRGNGGHSRRFGAFNHEQIEDWSDEFREGYFSGAFDETCEPCNGSGKVYGLNEEFLSDEALAFIEEAREAFRWTQSEEWGERFCG